MITPWKHRQKLWNKIESLKLRLRIKGVVGLGQSKFIKFKSKNTYFLGGKFSHNFSFDKKLIPWGTSPVVQVKTALPMQGWPGLFLGWKTKIPHMLRPKYKEKLKEKNWSHTCSIWYLNLPCAFSPGWFTISGLQSTVAYLVLWTSHNKPRLYATGTRRLLRFTGEETESQPLWPKSPWFWVFSTNRPQGHLTGHAGQILTQEKFFDSEQETPRRVCMFLSIVAEFMVL